LKGIKCIFNIHGANHAAPIMDELISSHTNWSSNLYKDRCDFIFLWHTTPDEEIYEFMNKNCIVNRYPAIKDLANKDSF